MVEVIERLRSAISLYVGMRPEAIHRAIQSFNKRAKQGVESPELMSARATLARLEKQEQNLVNAVSMSGGDIASLVTTLRATEEEKRRCAERISELEAEHSVTFQPIDETEFLKSAKQILQALRKHGDIPKELLRAVVSRVYLDLSPATLYKQREQRKKELTEIVSSRSVSERSRRKAAEELASLYERGSRINVIPRFSADQTVELVKIKGRSIMIPRFSFEQEGLPASVATLLGQKSKAKGKSA